MMKWRIYLSVHDGMKNDEQWSEAVKDMYTAEQINSFLDKTKGKSGVEIGDYFPDGEKFISSVIWAKKMSSYDELSQQKRFRFNYFKKPGDARGKINNHHYKFIFSLLLSFSLCLPNGDLTGGISKCKWDEG